MATAWRPISILPPHLRPSFEVLGALVDGSTPVVTFERLISEHRCSAVVSAFGRADSQLSRDQRVARSCDPCTATNRDAREIYFDHAEKANAFLWSVPGATELLATIFGLVSRITGRRVVFASSHDPARLYAVAEFRVHGRGEGATIHRDRASSDAVGWEVAEHAAQLSMVLILQAPTTGGELRVYNHQWTPEDDRFKNRDAPDYDVEVVRAAEYIDVRPMAGALYLLNPSFFHEVYATRGHVARISLGCFLGFDPTDTNGAIAVWA